MMSKRFEEEREEKDDVEGEVEVGEEHISRTSLQQALETHHRMLAKKSNGKVKQLGKHSLEKFCTNVLEFEISVLLLVGQSH